MTTEKKVTSDMVQKMALLTIGSLVGATILGFVIYKSIK